MTVERYRRGFCRTFPRFGIVVPENYVRLQNQQGTARSRNIVTGSKITALVLGWVETLVFRSDSRGFGVAGPFWPYAVASIVW